MRSPSERPRTGVSTEAELWLRANPPAGRITIDDQNAELVRAAVREGWEPSMAAARAEFAVRENVLEINGVECLEVTPASGVIGRGTVLYFFGGGHTVGSPEEDIVISAPLAALAGVRVIAPRYPLAPEHPYPAAVSCAEMVYRALLDDTDPAQLVVAGESAGGNLALALFQRARSARLSMPAGFVLLSPWADMGFTGDSHITNRDPFLAMTDNVLLEMAARYRGEAPIDDPLISPIHADFTGLPPTLITTGTRDLLLSDAVRLDTAMRIDGVDVTLRVWEGMWHVFEFYREVPEARASMAEIANFVADQFASSAI